MFTGLIETTGKLQKLAARSNYKLLTLEASFEHEEIVLGESIACDGACLTVVSFDDKSFTVEASQETVARTILDGYKVGDTINLERALRVGDRLGGHFVSGHVDTVGKVDRVQRIGESWEIAVTFDSAFDKLVVDKGSIAIDGLSLTVNTCRDGWLSVNVIPHTAQMTTIARLERGDRVNLEFDLIGKYMAKMVSAGSGGKLTLDKLKESGW